jgi:hypothetical protein
LRRSAAPFIQKRAIRHLSVRQIAGYREVKGFEFWIVQNLLLNSPPSEVPPPKGLENVKKTNPALF